MRYMSVSEAAKKWGISESSVRSFCSEGRIADAFLDGKVWRIPESAAKPERHSDSVAEKTLLDVINEGRMSDRGGAYRKLQVGMTYNSSRMDGGRLTYEQTKYIFDTNAIGEFDETVWIDDAVETANHFICVDKAIDSAADMLSEDFILRLYATLKRGTSDSCLEWFYAGDYYRNSSNGFFERLSSSPGGVVMQMQRLLADYGKRKRKTLDELLDFHCRFEKIQPFRDGNGRVGRLILLKECFRCGIMPFIIDDDKKLYYYRGMKEWQTERRYLRDTCLAAQDKFKAEFDLSVYNFA